MTRFAQTPIDRVRTYWDGRPCNIRHSPKPVGTREYFDEVEARKYLVEPHIPAFAEFERWQGKRVLEIGSGIGTDTINFARAGAGVTAVDLSEKSLDVARRRAEVFGVSDRISFIHSNAEHLTAGAPGYDLIYSFGVLHHTPHPKQAVIQTEYFARKGTEFRFMVYNRDSWKVLGIWLSRFYKGVDLFATTDELVARHSEAETGCPVTYTYTPQSIRRLLAGTRWRITSIETAHIFPYRVADYVQYRYVKAFPWNVTPGPMFRWMERQCGWHLLVKAVAE